MNLEELIKKFNEFKSAASLKLDDANKALADGDTEKAAQLQEEYDGLMTSAKSYQAQIERVRAHDDAVVESTTKATRVPFETQEDEEDDEIDITKSIYVMRYGDENSALKAVVTDLFGPDYNEKREQQKGDFVKYIRTGRQSAELDNLIYTPEQVQAEIKAGYSVAEIEKNRKTQQEGALELGGALVPEDYRAQVIKRMVGATVVRQRARVITTTRDKVEWPQLLGGDDQYTSAVRVTWVDEIPSSATVANTEYRLGMLNIPVHTVMARNDVSRNLLEDSAIDVVNLIGEQFAEASAIDEDNQFLVGRGGGTPQGILGAGTAAEPAPVSGITTVNSGSAAALDADGLIDVAYELAAQYRRNAVWVGARKTFREVRQLKTGAGEYLWSMAIDRGGIERGAPSTLLDYPWLEDENMPAIAANAYPIIFGDLMGYLIADRVGMTIERVTDTTTVGRNYVALFMRRRLGGQVIEPWKFIAQKVATN